MILVFKLYTNHISGNVSDIYIPKTKTICDKSKTDYVQKKNKKNIEVV